MKELDLTGKIFQNLTVLEKSKEKTKNGHVCWTCRCICGRLHTRRGYVLKENKVCPCTCQVGKKLRGKNHNFNEYVGKIISNFKILSLTKDRGKKESTYLCQCLLCGNIVSKRATIVIDESIKECPSCASKKRKERFLLKIPPGTTFGKLTVISFSHVECKNNSSASWFNCKCECGNELKVRGTCLSSKGQVGCTQCKRIEKGEAAFNKVIYNYKKGAKERGLDFKLEKEEIRRLCRLPCHYCGSLPSSTSRTKERNGDFIYNGIDRINNNLGYLTNNVISCCRDCNRIKGTLKVEELKIKIIKMYEMWAKK